MININGEGWDIILVSWNHPSLLKDDGTYTIGCCDDITKCVYICENLNRDKFKKVLCHELTHAAMFSYNVYMTIEQEEILADLLSSYGQEIIDMTNHIFCRIKGCRKN